MGEEGVSAPSSPGCWRLKREVGFSSKEREQNISEVVVAEVGDYNSRPK